VSRRLEVLLHGEPVGTLSELPGGGTEFRLLDSYREQVPRPVLGQKFEDDLEKVHRSRKRQELPDFFANLIPETGRLREVIEKAGNLEPGDDLELLTFVGRDLPGAVVVRPVGEEELKLPLEEPEDAPTDEGHASESGDPLRFSLAGVQLKFSMLRADDRLALPAKNQEGEWIVKFDSPAFRRLPENELSMLRWAREAGFEVPEHHLHELEDVVGFPRRYGPSDSRVLAIRRYDRSPEGRVHQEDFAQVVGLPPSKKYDQITYEVMARLVRGFLGEEAVDELIRRLVLVVACGNNDAHLKNWSLVYPDGIQARWSPLYDQVSTIAWEAPDRALALKLAGVKAFGEIDRAAFERFADKTDLERQRVLRQVEDTLSRLLVAWRGVAEELPLPQAHRAALRKHWRAVPILREAGRLD